MAPDAPTTFDDGPLHIDFERREVTVHGKPVALSSSEYDLLTGLVMRRPEALSRDQMLEQREVTLKTMCIQLNEKLTGSEDSYGPIFFDSERSGFAYGHWHATWRP